MLRAVELAAGVRTTTSPNPWVGCVIVDRPTGEIVEGATRPPPRAPRRGRGARGRPASRPRRRRRHRLRHARAVQPPRAHPALRRRARGGEGRPGGGRHRRPRPQGQRAGASSACAPPGSTCSRASGPTSSPISSPPTSPTAPPAGPTWCSSWPPASTDARRRPTAPAGGSPARRPAPTPTACGPRAMRAGGRRHGAGRRPRASRAPRRGPRPAAGGAGPGAGGCQGPPVPRARRRPGDVLDELGRAGRPAGAGRGRRDRRRRLPPGRPGRRLRRLPGPRAVRRRRRPRVVLRRGSGHDGRRLARARSPASTPLGDDLRVDLRPARST